MKNNGKTEANKENTDELTWDFELVWDNSDIVWENINIEWDNNDIKWDITEIEWSVIDIVWSTDDYVWDTKINSEDNVKEGVKNRERIVKKQNGNRIKTGE